MKLARIQHEGEVRLVREEGDDWIEICIESSRPGADALREALADEVAMNRKGPSIPRNESTLLPPVAHPSKIIAIGLNYADHARESGAEAPKAPLIFVKTPNSIIGPGAPIVWRSEQSAEVDFEAELAVVIGRCATRVQKDPLSYVLGYTCCNDVSARDAQFADGQWIRGKSFDTFCPLGPWIVTSDEVPDPQELAIGCDINGERMQNSNTSEMIFSVEELVRYISGFMTLEPGDVIATGTPWGVGFARKPPRYLSSGDDVTVWVERVGSLTNSCQVN